MGKAGGENEEALNYRINQEIQEEVQGYIRKSLLWHLEM